MTIPVRTMTDDRLLQDMAVHRENSAIGVEIIRRINRYSKATGQDAQLVSDAVERLRTMEEIDSDLIDQSGRCKILCQEYLEIRNQLLQRMKGEQPAELCAVN